jgi:hypothetical protein
MSHKRFIFMGIKCCYTLPGQKTRNRFKLNRIIFKAIYLLQYISCIVGKYHKLQLEGTGWHLLLWTLFLLNQNWNKCSVNTCFKHCYLKLRKRMNKRKNIKINHKTYLLNCISPSLSVTCGRLVVFSWYPGFLHH